MVIRIWLWIELDSAGKSGPKLGKPSAQVVECDCNVNVFMRIGSHDNRACGAEQ